MNLGLKPASFELSKTVQMLMLLSGSIYSVPFVFALRLTSLSKLIAVSRLKILTYICNPHSFSSAPVEIWINTMIT